MADLNEASLASAHKGFKFDFSWQWVPEAKEPPMWPGMPAQGTDEFHRYLNDAKNRPITISWWDYYSRPENIDDFLRDCVRVVAKSGDLVPLDVDFPKYQRAQRFMLKEIVKSLKKTRTFLGVVLKARQWGCSTLTDGIILWFMLFDPRYKALIVGQKDSTVAELLQSVRNMIDYLPDWIRPKLKYKDMSERLVFDGFNQRSCLYQEPRGEGSLSVKDLADPMRAQLEKMQTYAWVRIFKITEGEFSRGLTARAMHGTEVALWPDAQARRARSSLMATISTSYAGSFLVYESTADGISGMFSEIWQGAVRDPSDRAYNFHIPIFIPWFWIADYDLTDAEIATYFGHLDTQQMLMHLSQGFPGLAGLDKEEVELWEKYGVKLSQILWRRRQMAMMDDPSIFKQEYPATPEEAFLREGDSVFRRESLAEMLEKCTDPRWRFTLDENNSIWPEVQSLEEDPDGNIFVWEKPEVDPETGRVTHDYAVIVDPSEGSNSYLTKMRDPKDGEWTEGYVKEGDNTAILVGDLTTNRLVARVKGRIPPEQTASLAYKLGYMYGTAIVAPENNSGFGTTVIDRGREIGYPAMFLKRKYDDSQRVYTFQYGWRTDMESRAAMFGTAKGAIWRKSWHIPDRELIGELMGMVYKRTKTGAPKEVAGPGSKDDMAVAFTILARIAKEERYDEPPPPQAKKDPMTLLFAKRDTMSPEAFVVWKRFHKAHSMPKSSDEWPNS